jgi:hypothetical protein
MKRIVKIKGLCSKPLQQRYLSATPGERQALLDVVRQESQCMIDKMRAKGFQLEGTAGDIYGIFTRGQGRGTIRLGEDAAIQEESRTPVR